MPAVVSALRDPATEVACPGQWIAHVTQCIYLLSDYTLQSLNICSSVTTQPDDGSLTTQKDITLLEDLLIHDSLVL
jgi:hypothetical protein